VGAGQVLHPVLAGRGRVVRTYFGAELIGQLAAQQDANDRERRALRKAQAIFEQHAAGALDRDLRALERLADALARAALVAAGCHQHRRGDWRRKCDARPG